MQFDSFWSDVFATIVGGALLALLFFYLKEKLFALPDLNGRWYFEITTEESANNPYKGMVLHYVE